MLQREGMVFKKMVDIQGYKLQCGGGGVGVGSCKILATLLGVVERWETTAPQNSTQPWRLSAASGSPGQTT